MDKPVHVECDNCNWTGLVEQCDEISDLLERLDTGGEVPAGQCPECNCLAYLTPQDNPFAKFDADKLAQALADVIEWDARMGFHDSECWQRARDIMDQYRKFSEQKRAELTGGAS